MSRRRYISTDISTDVRLAELAEFGFLSLLLYTWAIPHFDDWGRMNGDARQFKLTVCPALDVSTKEVDEALDRISASGLWMRYHAEGKNVIAIPADRWFKHQSYISKEKRVNDEGSNFRGPEYRETPLNAEEHRETPQIAEIQKGMAQIAASFSLSSSLSPSPSKNSSGSSSDNPFVIFTNHGFGTLDDMTREFICAACEDYSDKWVIEAMKEAVAQNKKTWKYVEGILKRWKTLNHPEPWTVDKPEQKPSGGNVAPFPQRSYGKQQKPQIPVAKPTSGSALSPEEIERLRESSKRLDERFNSHMPLEVLDATADRPF